MEGFLMHIITEILRPYIFQFIEICLVFSALTFFFDVHTFFSSKSKVSKTIIISITVFIFSYVISVYNSSVEVPNVTELEYGEAKQTLQEKGFSHFVNGPSMNGDAIVIKQHPPEGTVVSKKTCIELTLTANSSAENPEELSIFPIDQKSFPIHDSTIQNASSVIYPYEYTTQFQDDVKGSKCKPSQMKMIFDNNHSTNYYWTIWRSVYSDDIPEFTLSFNGVTINGLNIRTGNLANEQSYYSSARLKNISLDIISNGEIQHEYITLPDRYSLDYHQIRFARSCQDVTSIKIWYHDAYKGIGESENHCYITDLEFY